MTTAANQKILGCPACGLAQREGSVEHKLSCARCGARLHFRKPNSVGRTWALVIAAYVLIIPANLMPVMATGSLFGTEKDTIFGGVQFLWESN